jgi:ankyrin repeat protein
MFASEEGHSAIVELLLEAGADANDVISDVSNIFGVGSNAKILCF